MSTLIILTILVYFLIILGISKITSKKSGNNIFFTANKKSPWYIVSIGMLGASISGVTFISVPGIVRSQDMTYMQMVFGFFFGYLIVAYILLPLYYRLNLISIYQYLRIRFGTYSYKTGASFFILSKLIGASARLYLVALILHKLIQVDYNIPFYLIVICLVFFIWLYTQHSGIKTIVWTDSFQTICLLTSLILIIWQISTTLNLSLPELMSNIFQNDHTRIFIWNDFIDKNNFFKQFVSGILIVIVMTGLDQDMMQKNLTCKTLKDSQKNMISYGFSFIPVNFLFLVLGVLLLIFASHNNINLPEKSDEILPFLTFNYLGKITALFFIIGIVSATFSSIDSAMTSITTSIYIDILGYEPLETKLMLLRRKTIHLLVSLSFIITILIFNHMNNNSILNTIYKVASFTYGPLLGLFFIGLATKIQVKDKWVPIICIFSPILSLLLEYVIQQNINYQFGYEILIVNASITIFGLLFLKKRIN